MDKRTNIQCLQICFTQPYLVLYLKLHFVQLIVCPGEHWTSCAVHDGWRHAFTPHVACLSAFNDFCSYVLSLTFHLQALELQGPSLHFAYSVVLFVASKSDLSPLRLFQ
jgi:hypothetical protein